MRACPKCRSTHVAVEVKTWCDYVDGRPDHFDEEDVAHVEPVSGGQSICRDCQHQWKARAA